MNDYEQRIKILEEKVGILEETLETLKNMQMSEQMKGYLKSKTQTLRMAELINSLSDKTKFDLSDQQNIVKEIQIKKNVVDEKIAEAISRKNIGKEYDTDIKFFKYEIETGKYIYNEDDEYKIEALQPYIGQGIRITEYNGFDKTAVIPNTINGLPVVSIGTGAFQNAYPSEIILPNSVKAILGSAFANCKNIKSIILPEGIEYIGHNCFSNSSLEIIEFPSTIKTIGMVCYNCDKLKTVVVPENVEKVDSRAFLNNNTKRKSIECVFYGYNTAVSGYSFIKNIKTIYCLPGSTIQKYACEYGIPIKPLSEFKSEE